jgi:hypothetical protein
MQKTLLTLFWDRKKKLPQFSIAVLSSNTKLSCLTQAMRNSLLAYFELHFNFWPYDLQLKKQRTCRTEKKLIVRNRKQQLMQSFSWGFLSQSNYKNILPKKNNFYFVLFWSNLRTKKKNRKSKTLLWWVADIIVVFWCCLRVNKTFCKP